MTVLSGQTIRRLGIMSPCEDRKEVSFDGRTLSSGLGPAGYDLTLDWGGDPDESISLAPGGFVLAAANERFRMPDNVLGRICDKSSWARRGLHCFTTVVEPGWEGWLTLELANLGDDFLELPQGIPIAQAVFEFTDEPVERPYDGKYQNQESGPQEAR